MIFFFQSVIFLILKRIYMGYYIQFILRSGAYDFASYGIKI
nr:MAG TPA: hypothetical protein [Bacteriophage sp.]